MSLTTRRIDLEPGCWVEHCEGFVEPDEEVRLLAELPQSCPFEQHPLRLFGRSVLEPRLTAWCGDAEYSYSGRRLPPRPWPDAVRQLARRLEIERREVFNHVLMNLYRDGADSMGFHSDDELELGRDPLIAAISLGAERRFVLRPKSKSRRDRSELALGRGSLIVMGGSTQHQYQHGVPKTRVPVAGPRLSLTFRRVVGREHQAG